MKFIRDDGTTVYKLTDFGAARELQEGQYFQSLYGTEEYLHPDMYERAVLRKHANKTFGATIDLWSIGVTLYHVATGNLPFRPYGGRRNKETMHHITTKKESGVISGIQTKENGPIEWKRELPNNCQLSFGLKKIITPLLAGLLEADHRKIWTFERFFKEVEVVLSRKALHVFHVNKAQLMSVYILPDETLSHFQAYLIEQTDILEQSQILLYKTKLFNHIVEDYTHATGYPKTTVEDPLFLFNRENNNVTITPDQELPKFTDFLSVISVENDAAQAKFACSIAYQCKRQIENYSLSSKLLRDTVENFTKYIFEELRQLNQYTQHLLDKTHIFRKTAQILNLSQQISGYSLKNNYSEKLDEISRDFVSSTAIGVTDLHKVNYQENTLKLQWDTISRDLTCPYKTLAPARAKTQVEHLRDSWQHLVRDRATRTLSYNDEQFHILERIKITQTINRLKALLEKEVFPQYEQMAENFGDWYKMAQNIHLKMEILLTDVTDYDHKLIDFEEELTIENVDYTEYVKNNFDHEKKTIPKKSRNTQNQKIKAFLSVYHKESESLKEILNENKSLINQINDITSELEERYSNSSNNG